MSLEKEIITIINAKDSRISLPKQHREFTAFDEVFSDLEHTKKDVQTCIWFLAKFSQEKEGIRYSDYLDILPFVTNPQALKAYFERGSGQTLMLFNKACLPKLGKELPYSIFCCNNFFLGGLGSIEEQKAFWISFTKEEDKVEQERLFLFSSESEKDYLGLPLHESLVRYIETQEKLYSYMTYYSFYNGSSRLLKNQYQRLSSLEGKGHVIKSMNYLWANRCGTFVRLGEAKIDVFVNMVTSDGNDVNQFFVKKDLSTLMRQAGLNFLSLEGKKRPYNDNTLDTIAKLLDDVLFSFKQKSIIEDFSKTQWLSTSMQEEEDIANEYARGFRSCYVMANEITGFEVQLSHSQNSIDSSL